MIRRRDLIRALGEYGLADWVLLEREQTLACADALNRSSRTERRVRWHLTVHHDAPSGRGSAHVVVDAADGDANAAVRQAATLARASVGPAWVTQPAAAPARVKLEDPSIAAREPLAVATEIMKTAAAPTTATVLREQVSVATRQGLRTEWRATAIRAEALVSRAERSIVVHREARRLDALGLAAAIGEAASDLGELAKAAPLAPGPCSLVLRGDALLHGGLGVWAAFVSQADALVERQGLTRYRETMPIVPGANTVAEPLAISSDGARDFGILSAPVGDRGDAVRRFDLVELGIAAGLGLSPREAALRGRDPNGGVRNLVVAPGSWSGAIAPAGVRVVDVRRLRSISLDPYTGDASLELSLSVEHQGGAATPVVGGAIRIDVIATLARARRSARTIVRGPYEGPEAVWIDTADVIA